MRSRQTAEHRARARCLPQWSALRPAALDTSRRRRLSSAPRSQPERSPGAAPGLAPWGGSGLAVASPRAIAWALAADLPEAESERQAGAALPQPWTSRSPTVEPDLGSRSVAPHQLGAQLDDLGVFGSELENHPPATGHRIGLGHNVADFALVGADHAAHSGGLDGLQISAGEVEDKPACIVRSGADAGRCEFRELWWVHFPRAPVKPIRKGVLALGLQGRFRTPVADNVVVDLCLARNLDQMDGTCPPVAGWFDPDTRPGLEARFKVLIGAKVPFALEQAEAAGIDVLECTDLKVLRIGKRSAELL